MNHGSLGSMATYPPARSASTANETAYMRNSSPVKALCTLVFPTRHAPDSSGPIPAFKTRGGFEPFATSCIMIAALAIFAALCQSSTDSRADAPNNGPVVLATESRVSRPTNATSSRTALIRARIGLPAISCGLANENSRTGKPPSPGEPPLPSRPSEFGTSATLRTGRRP